jgi:hypothetical protein
MDRRAAARALSLFPDGMEVAGGHLSLILKSRRRRAEMIVRACADVRAHG